MIVDSDPNGEREKEIAGKDADKQEQRLEEAIIFTNGRRR